MKTTATTTARANVGNGIGARRGGGRRWDRGDGGARPRPAGLAAGAGFALLAVALAAAPAHAASATEATTEVNAFAGALQSRVPIAVPGFRGIEPKLGLQYTSAGRNGFVGVGWGLTGVSVIERASPGKGTPRFDASDVYLLDGNELLPSCATFGGSHCTRVESYQKILWDGTNNRWYVWSRDGMKSTYAATFTTASGTLRWALTEVRDTRDNAVTYAWWCDGSPALECYLDTVSYNGVVVKLWREARTDLTTFATGAGLGQMSYRLKTIEVTVGGSRARAYALGYSTSTSTSRSTLTSVRQFGRDASVDGAGAVTGGTSLPAMTLASSGVAASWVSSSPAATITNSGSDEQQFLTGDFNGDGKSDVVQAYRGWTTSLPTCTSTGSAWSCASPAATLYNSGSSEQQFLTGDFNGDGKSDVAQAYSGWSSLPTCLSTGSGWSCSNPAATFTNATGVSASGSATNPYPSWGTAGAVGSGSSIVMKWGANNTWGTITLSGGVTASGGAGGAKGFIASRNGAVGAGNTFILYAYYGAWYARVITLTGATAWGGTADLGEPIIRFASSGNSVTFYGPTKSTTVHFSPNPRPRFHAADFNGDGKTDVVQTSRGFSSTPLCLSTGTGWSCSNPAAAISNSGSWEQEFLPADVDGDGKSDLVQAWRGWTTSLPVCRSTGAGFSCASWPATLVNSGSTEQQFLTGDFNGDGKVDVAQTYRGWSTIPVCLSTGSGWSCSTLPATIVNSGSAEQRFVALDVNGDGRTDIVQVYRGWTSYPVCLSTGSGWSCTTLPATIVNSGSNEQQFVAGDFDGNGKSDLVQAYRGWTALPLNLSGGPAVDLLTSIGNGLGGTSTVAYSPSSTWPNTLLPVGTVFPTVASVTVNDGRGLPESTATTTYAYEGAQFNAAAREFYGFRKATTTLASSGAYTETYYWQRAGTIAKPEATYKRRADGTVISFDTFRFTESPQAPYTSLATEVWSYECNGTGVFDAGGNYVSGCRRALTTYAWDQYANLTEERHHGDWDVSGDEFTAAYAFAPNVSAYLVGLPSYQYLYAGLGTGGALLSATRYFYDGATVNGTAPLACTGSNYPCGGTLTRKHHLNDLTGTYVGHDFAYDTYGNQTAVTDQLGQTATKTYDSTYRMLVTSTTNPLGHVVQTSWDAVLGVALTTTDADGNVSTLAYDALGRVTLTSAPGVAPMAQEYLNLGNPTTQKIRQSVQTPGGAWVWEDNYFDGVGRPYKKVGQNGVASETVYGATGKVWKLSLPFRADASGTPLETVYYDLTTYDELGRILTETRPDGSSTSRAYANGQASVTDAAGTVRTSYFDAQQRLVKVREVVGGQSHDTSFEYDLLGRRTKSVDAAGNVTAAVYNSLGWGVQKSDPDKGLWQYQYDAAGRITRETDARGQVSALAYDALGRVTRRTHPNATVDSFTFDEVGRGAAKGRLTTAVSASGVTTRAWYDVAGRRTRYEQVVDGQTYALSHAYDGAGRLTAMTYPDGEVVSFGYGTANDATLGRLLTLSGSTAGALVNGIGYTAKGQAASLTYGNGVTTTMTFDAWGERTTGIAFGSLATINYGYDGAGRVTSMSSPQLALTAWQYGYDGFGRLTRATNTANGAHTQSFAFDAIGRMTSHSAVGAYTYGSAAHAHAVTAAGANTYAYDANGNLTQGGGRTITYSHENRPLSIVYGGQTTSFVYDAAGQRVKKAGPAGTVVYVGGVYEKRGTAVTKYYLAGGVRVAKRDANGNQYFHADHLGSTRLITNQSGAEVKRYDYAPFGSVIAESGSLPDSHRFTGQEADDETGLMFYQARYYDPALGRFLSPDALLPDANDPQQLDLYAYARNNPINFVDPSGHAGLVAAVFSAVGWTAAAAWVTANAMLVNLVIGVALSFTNNPILQTIGMILVGYAGPGLAGSTWTLGGLSAPQVGALVAALQSPISPLDPVVKKVIGWAYTIYAGIQTIENLAEAGKGLLLDSSAGAWLGSKIASISNAVLRYAAATVALAAQEWIVAKIAQQLMEIASGWSLSMRYVAAFVAGVFGGWSKATPGPLAMLGATYDLYYTLKYPDGRVYDLSGGADGAVTFTFYYHTGYEYGMAMGRQHIRVGDGHGFWEIDTNSKYKGPNATWSGWVTTQKITVIMSPTQAAVFTAALEKGSQSTGGYVTWHADSYTYVSAALQYATGKSASDLHINPGMNLGW